MDCGSHEPHFIDLFIYARTGRHPEQRARLTSETHRLQRYLGLCKAISALISDSIVSSLIRHLCRNFMILRR
jgi:hypothetical protein